MPADGLGILPVRIRKPVRCFTKNRRDIFLEDRQVRDISLAHLLRVDCKTVNQAEYDSFKDPVPGKNLDILCKCLNDF
jgi:hypothetical protein